MNPDKLVEMLKREALKRRYASINWNAHLVPVVREAVAEFGRASSAKDHPLPQVALRSEAIGRGEIVGDPSAEAGDTLTIQFGVAPGGSDAFAPPGYSRPIIAAGKTALVFAQATSGAVAVFLYPTGTPAAKPSHIGDFRDPADLTRSRVRRLLGSLFDMHCNDSRRPTAAPIYSHRRLAPRDYTVGHPPRLGRV